MTFSAKFKPLGELVINYKLLIDHVFIKQLGGCKWGYVKSGMYNQKKTCIFSTVYRDRVTKNYRIGHQKLKINKVNGPLNQKNLEITF